MEGKIKMSYYKNTCEKCGYIRMDCQCEKINICEHKNGWYLEEGQDIVISSSPDATNDGLEAEFVCNTIGCSEKKIFTFEITDVKKKKAQKSLQNQKV